MIKAVEIKNFLLIEHTCLNLDKGFSVITGESGSGKSLLFKAIRFCLGANIEKSYIGPWSDTASVVLKVSMMLPQEIVTKYGLKVSDSLTIEHSMRTKSRFCKLNGKKISQEAIREVSHYIMLDSQQQQAQKLLKPSFQLAMIDRSIDTNLLQKHQSLLEAYRQQKATCDRIDKLLNENTDIEWIERTVQELAFIDSEEMYSELISQQKEYQNSKILVSQWPEINKVLYAAEKSLMSLSKMNLPQSLDDSVISTNDALLSTAEKIEQFLQDSMESRYKLESIQQSIELFNDYARKHKVPPSQLFALKQSLAKQIEELQNAKLAQSEAHKQTILCADKFSAIDKKLQSARGEVARQLTEWLEPQLVLLGMEHAAFQVTWTNDENILSFEMKTNPGQQFKLIGECLSGGELSRLNLLLMIFSGDKRTLLLDEVDAGVSGSIGHKIRKMLVSLSVSRQVIAISHLAQVAIGAKSHFVANKQQKNENMCATMTRTSDQQDRAKEIARLMCGIVNAETQEQAIALLCHQD